MSQTDVINFSAFKDNGKDQPVYMDSGYANEAKFWAFMGVAGGSGTTSLCIQAAHELVRNVSDRNTKPRVCLFDLDFEQGACAQYLDVDPVLTHEDLTTARDHLDLRLFGSMVTNLEYGFDLLATSKRLDGNSYVHPTTVLQLLDILSQNYDYVILDVPRIWVPWTHAAIGGANRFGFVTELTVPSLQNLQTLPLMFREKVPEFSEFNIIVNKHDRRSFRTALSLADVKNAVKRQPDAVLGFYTDIVRESINRGEPVGVKHSNSRYVREIRQLVENWKSQEKNRAVATA